MEGKEAVHCLALWTRINMGSISMGPNNKILTGVIYLTVKTKKRGFYKDSHVCLR